MLEIFAHRVLYNEIENNLKAIPFYEKLNIGIELDLRYGEDGVYISHDVKKNGILFEDMCKNNYKSKIRMALHIKEIKSVNETIMLLKKYSMNNYFLFNTENNDLVNLVDKYYVASYVSQKKNEKNTDILWCDEIDEKWYDEEVISDLHKKNKILYAMSLEVVKRCNKTEMIREWDRLIELGINGICTKYPEKLNSFLAKRSLK
jgi:glycerophosphoryl diester phosphodiesterase